MDSRSQTMLRRVEQNDATMINVRVGDVDRQFHRDLFLSSHYYSRLGAAIGNNNHLTKLTVASDDEDPLDAANTEFFNGLKRNSSIKNLELTCNGHTLVGGVGHEILKLYQKINNNLTRLCIERAVLENGGVNTITETLRLCTNLRIINFGYTSITDEQLLPMVEAIKGGCNTSLEDLHLFGNRIGNAGCHVLATLLEDPNSNIQTLHLGVNQIGNEGATAIANSLANNTKLQRLYLTSNPFDQRVVGIFCTVLCNTSSINSIYSSNHTLHTVHLDHPVLHDISTLLSLNGGLNKSHVAIRKILKYHPNIDMGPLFEWDAEGEQTLKALPYVISWFERAGVAVADGRGSVNNDEDSSDNDDDEEEEQEDYQTEQKKLSAIFEFAKAMPVLFVPASNIKVNDSTRKRKRGIV